MVALVVMEKSTCLPSSAQRRSAYSTTCLISGRLVSGSPPKKITFSRSWAAPSTSRSSMLLRAVSKSILRPLFGTVRSSL
ncbi:hypothetical protein D9M71_577910 [compost metagenome]